MKKVFILLSALLALAVSCQKHDAIGAKDDFSDAPWAVDRSLQVPITLGMDDMFSVKANTKAAVTSMTDVKFGVLAVDTSATVTYPAHDWSILLKDKIAMMGNDGWSKFVKPDGSDVTYYYPLETTDQFNYSFYAYRTTDEDNADAYAVVGDVENGFTKDVVIGFTDVLWAKSVADTLIRESPADTVAGFNADYIRKARLWYPGTWQTTYAPVLHFNHLTTALHFYVVAESVDAEATLTEVSLSNLTLYGVYTGAQLDVMSGTLAATGNKGSLVMASNPVVPVYNGNDGTEFGTGFFILPTTEAMSVNFTMIIPDAQGVDGEREYRRASPYAITPPTGGFQAGKSYKFRIIVKDLVTISAKVDLEGWDEDTQDTDLLPVIGD